MAKKLVICLIGPPGSGKGTAASFLCEKFNLVHFCAGDIFRKKCKEQTELGNRINKIMAEGKLVPDEIIMELFSEFIELNQGHGYILDAMPRTIGQAVGLEKVMAKHGLKINIVFNLVVDEETVITRMTGRMVHVPSGRIYHAINFPPKVPNCDDITGEPLVTRSDDNPETIRTRIRVFKDSFCSIIKYYNKKDVVVEIDASINLPDVMALVENKISQILH